MSLTLNLLVQDDIWWHGVVVSYVRASLHCIDVHLTVNWRCCFPFLWDSNFYLSFLMDFFCSARELHVSQEKW